MPAKYLPGGIWQSVARFAVYREYQVKNSDSLAILVLEHLIALGVSVCIGAGIFLCIDTSGFVAHIAPWILLTGLALLTISIYWIMRMRPGRSTALLWMVMAVASAAIFWCLAALTFVAYWKSIFDVYDADMLAIVACYLLSWAAGFVAIFAPQGLGVFEWTAGHLLPPTQTLSETVTVVAGFRFVTITGDLLAWMLGMAVSYVTKGRNR
ncbi:MAG: hypothetical protein LC114_01390 [Bryobacterales bacterium]|nr:hypothetical protein [Bryobacterales bacterium]